MYAKDVFPRAGAGSGCWAGRSTSGNAKVDTYFVGGRDDY